MKFFFINLWLVALLAMPQTAIAVEKITIGFIDKDSGFEKISLTVEYAMNEKTRERGLMFRHHLPDRGGMLFLFDQPQIVSMWMKNTPLALDMIFIGHDGRVKTIASHAVPYSKKIISSKVPVKWVLEILAGKAKQYHITIGDMMVIK
ncbi:MAG: DUF192 domain-containing protein [Alphaproteobacteria bacterium]